jgi:type VI secretion system protein ImpK
MSDPSTIGSSAGSLSKSPAGGFRAERLALLYEAMITAIVRVQSGRQQIQGSDVFRERMKRALEEITDSAGRKGYGKDDVQQANFAVIAFLDEAVLNSQDPGRTQWARKSLQEELFDQRSAGELFFKRLEELRAHADSSQLAEVLEVYCLCLLLGYEGRYVGSKAELHLLMDHLRERIERISGRNPEFSPDAKPPDQAPAPPPADPLPRRLRWAALGALALALLFYLVFYASLSGRVSEVRQVAQRVTN